MRIALFSDIHGNNVAFKAAIAHAKEQGADMFIVTGDMVSDYPQSSAVLDSAKELTPYVLIGNRDKYCLNLHDGLNDEMKHYRQMKPLIWTSEHLRPEDITYLRSLPDKIIITLDGGKSLLAVHNSPGNKQRCLHPDKNDAIVGEVMRRLPHDILICGHYHKPIVKGYGEKLFVNPGSVGENFSGAFVADYGLLTCENKNISCDIFHVPYDGKTLADIVEQSGMMQSTDVAFWMWLLLTMQTADRDLFEDFFALAEKCKRQQGYTCSHLPDEIWEQTTEYFKQNIEEIKKCFRLI